MTRAQELRESRRAVQAVVKGLRLRERALGYATRLLQEVDRFIAYHEQGHAYLYLGEVSKLKKRADILRRSLTPARRTSEATPAATVPSTGPRTGE